MQNAPVGQIPASRTDPTRLRSPVHPRPGPSASHIQSGGSLHFITHWGEAWPPPCLKNALKALIASQEHNRAQDSPRGGWTDCN